jgi:hypothetical protein
MLSQARPAFAGVSFCDVMPSQVMDHTSPTPQILVGDRFVPAIQSPISGAIEEE